MDGHLAKPLDGVTLKREIDKFLAQDKSPPGAGDTARLDISRKEDYNEAKTAGRTRLAVLHLHDMRKQSGRG